MPDDIALGIFVALIVGNGCLLLLWAAPEDVRAEGHSPSFDHIGAEATVIELTTPFMNNTRTGRVRVGNESWRATFHTAELGIGDTVIIQAREGLTLICGPRESAPSASPLNQATASSPRSSTRIGVGFGVTTTILLLCLVSFVAALAFLSLPSSATLGIGGFFAPLLTVLILMLINGVRASSQLGVKVRTFRSVIAGACALAAFCLVVQGFFVSLLPLTAAFVLAMSDPVLRDIVKALAIGIG